MTAFSEIALSPIGVALNTAAMLLLFFRLYLLGLAVRSKRGGLCALCAARAAVGTAAVTLLFDGLYTLDYLPFAREWFGAVLFVGKLPWAAIAIAKAVSAALSAFLLVYTGRSARSSPSAYTVKEATDLLPVGICFGKSDGTAALLNLKMNDVARAITGADMSDVNEFIETARNKGEDEDGRLIVKSGDGVYVLEQSVIEVDEKRYNGIVAEDQTVQYRAVAEVEEKNARLRDLQIRLKAFRVREEDLLMKQEILEARTTIHTQFGGALLTGKYYFEHPENVDARELLALLRRINTYLLAEAEAPEDGRDELDEALKMAKRIGVALEIDGDLPEDATLRRLLGRAVAECAANTVKHASGDRVDVSLLADGKHFVMTLTNNGRAPSGEIRESGGLASLRRFAESVGAAMTVQSAPAFLLTVDAPASSDGDGIYLR